MAFVNEYVPQADYEKYDMKNVCAEHNRQVGRDWHVYFHSWTIDHDKDAFLVRIWSHREANFEGYAFCWKGEWMFFDARPAGHKYDKTRNAIWFRFLVKGFAVPDRLIAQRETVVADLKEAITVNDAVTCIISNRSATIEFVGEQWA